MIKNNRTSYLLVSVLVALIGSSTIWFHQVSQNKELLKAAGNADFPTIQRALESGAKVNYQDKHGETALIAATRTGKSEIVAYLLDRGADVNAQNLDGQTPLMNAAQFGSIQEVQVLLRHGAKVNTWDANTNTALSNAVEARNLGIVELLLRHGSHSTSASEALVQESKAGHG